MSDSLPNLLANFDAWIRTVTPENLGLVLDFDGTMSELVPVPDDAKMHPDIPAPLASLKAKLGLTAVLSGRPARDLQSRVGMDGIMYVGNHGIEYLSDGELTQVPQAAELPISPEDLIERLKPIGDGPGVVWEAKQFSLAIHFRMSPDKPRAFLSLLRAVDTVPEIQHMDMISGNMVMELRAKTTVNKGFAIEKIVREHNLDSILFLGDDTTDVDALKAVRQLNSTGEINGVGVAVMQEGTPAAVLENSDYSLDGVKDVAQFLKMLNESTT